MRLRSPFLHFLLIGGSLFALGSWHGSPPAGRETIVVPAARLADLRREWERAHGETPGPADEASLVEREIEEEVLFREALRYGLDRDNTFVHYRLATLMRFLTEDEDSPDEELIREARELGLQRTDLVIRRHLVENVRLLAGKALAAEPVTAADLRAALVENAEGYRRPARIALTQIFFGTDRRGEKARTDAEDMLIGLRAGSGGETAAGDPFIHGAKIALLSEAELAARFGNAFARQAFAMPTGEWNGPLASSYGFHLVRVDARDDGGVPDVEAVRHRLVRHVEDDRADERLRRRVAKWRSRYDVAIGESAS